MGQVSAHWSKYVPGIPLKVSAQVGRNPVQEAGSLVCGFSLKCSIHTRPRSAMAARLWLWIWAQLTARSPSWQVYSFSGSTVLIQIVNIYWVLSLSGTKLYLDYIFKIFYLFIFRGRGREGEREGEKHQCVVVSHMPPTGDLACNPHMCPDWESNQWPSGLQAGIQSTEPHHPGLD